MLKADLERLAREVVDGGVAPASAVGFAKYFDGRWEIAVGGATDTIFDLASLTKPMTAVTAIGSIATRGRSMGVNTS